MASIFTRKWIERSEWGSSVDFYWLPVKIDVGLSVQKFLKK
jgi:hypothetical protein